MSNRSCGLSAESGVAKRGGIIGRSLEGRNASMSGM